jgi:hypothetical protein
MNEHWTLQEIRGRLENMLLGVEAMIHNLDNASDPQEQAITVGDLEDVRTGILTLLQSLAPVRRNQTREHEPHARNGKDRKGR